MVEIGHSHYSPDLIPADFFYFWKQKLKGSRFQDVDDTRQNMTTILKMVPLDGSSAWFMQLLERCKKSVAVKGDCFKENRTVFLFCVSVAIH
jgi:hypothetical protein